MLDGPIRVWYYSLAGRTKQKNKEARRRDTMAKAIEDINGTVPSDEDESEDNATEQLRTLVETNPNQRTSVMVTMPAAMKLKLVEAADEKNFTVARLCREMLADVIEFDLPDVVRTRARKYKTDEERIAAQKKKAAQRRNLINTLLKAYKAGELDIDTLMEDDDEA